MIDELEDSEKTKVVRAYEHLAFLFAIKGEGIIPGHVMTIKDKGSIGRSPDNTLTIKNQSLSARHIGIIFDNSLNEFILEDYSNNGTWVNGVEVKNRITLKDNDFVKLVNIEMVFKKVW